MNKILTEKVNPQTFIDQFISKVNKMATNTESYKQSIDQYGDNFDDNFTLRKYKTNLIKCARSIILVDPTIPILNKNEILNYIDVESINDPTSIEYDFIQIEEQMGEIDFDQNLPGGNYCNWVAKILLARIKKVISAPDSFFGSQIKLIVDILWRFQTEDSPNLFFNLCLFYKFKQLIPEHNRDINSIKSFWGLKATCNHVIEHFKKKVKIDLIDGEDYTLLAGSFNNEVSKWMSDPHKGKTFAAILHTHKAARVFGKNTDWCTALNYPRFFDLYTQDGSNLYVYSHNNDVIKEPVLVQFHTPSEQNKDYKDEEIPFALSNPSAKIVYDYIMDGDAPTIDKFYLILNYSWPRDTLKRTLNDLALKLLSENVSIITEQIKVIMDDVKTSIFSSIAQINMTLDIASKVRVEDIPELEQDIFGSTQSIDRSYFRHIATNFFNNGNNQFDFIMNSYITKSMIAISRFASINNSNNTVEYTVDIIPHIKDNTRLSKILQQLFPEIFSQIISEYGRMVKTNL